MQIRDLDDEVVRTFKVRASAEGKSLQSYMHDFLTAYAKRPTNRELFERIDRWAAEHTPDGLTQEFVVNSVREDRDTR
ncbi:MAG: FitA-like ribbon-helix-helix domain-containing protein [Pseudonocardiaceae bacterium]